MNSFQKSADVKQEKTGGVQRLVIQPKPKPALWKDSSEKPDHILVLSLDRNWIGYQSLSITGYRLDCSIGQKAL
jgi:hypothetical protein